MQIKASLAQQAARQSHNLKVVSSILTGGKVLLTIQTNKYFPSLLYLLFPLFFSLISTKISHTGNRTRDSWVKARYPNHQTIWEYICRVKGPVSDVISWIKMKLSSRKQEFLFQGLNPAQLINFHSIFFVFYYLVTLMAKLSIFLFGSYTNI